MYRFAKCSKSQFAKLCRYTVDSEIIDHIRALRALMYYLWQIRGQIMQLHVRYISAVYIIYDLSSFSLFSFDTPLSFTTQLPQILQWVHGDYYQTNYYYDCICVICQHNCSCPLSFIVSSLHACKLYLASQGICNLKLSLGVGNLSNNLQMLTNLHLCREYILYTKYCSYKFEEKG